MDDDSRVGEIEMEIEQKEDPIDGVCPEKTLIANIFWRALRDAQQPHICTQEEYRHAWHWLFSDSKEPYTAVWYAEIGGLEYFLRYCRRRLK